MSGHCRSGEPSLQPGTVASPRLSRGRQAGNLKEKYGITKHLAVQTGIVRANNQPSLFPWLLFLQNN